MSFDPRNPDSNLVVTFTNLPVKNLLKSMEAGRPIFDTVEHCTIRRAGSRDTTIQPATAVAAWIDDHETGEPRKQTYAERFSAQYRQFKERQTQTMTGTPIEYATFLTEGERATLRAMNVYIVEQLAAVDGQDLKNLGPGGREFKNRAIEFLEAAKVKSVDSKLTAEMEAMRARLAVVEEDNVALAAKNAALAAANASSANGEGGFANMTDDQLRDYIKQHAGHAPQGNLNRKMLVEMATRFQPKAA